jgi:hypothetical protein
MYDISKRNQNEMEIQKIPGKKNTADVRNGYTELGKVCFACYGLSGLPYLFEEKYKIIQLK